MSERARVAASLPAAGLPHSEFLNYVIKFNATTWQEPNKVAFDRTKSFNNCKLLSQHFSTESLCPPAPLELHLHATCHTPGDVLVSPCLWYFHFASARDQIFKDTRREQHFEFDSETGNPCEPSAQAPAPVPAASPAPAHPHTHSQYKRTTECKGRRDKEAGSLLKIQLKFS